MVRNIWHTDMIEQIISPNEIASASTITFSKAMEEERWEKGITVSEAIGIITGKEKE